MQNLIPKFIQISTICEKPGYLSEKLKTFANFFGWKFAPVCYLTMSTKGCLGFFKFYLDLELLIKM